MHLRYEGFALGCAWLATEVRSITLPSANIDRSYEPFVIEASCVRSGRVSLCCPYVHASVHSYSSNMSRLLHATVISNASLPTCSTVHTRRTQAHWLFWGYKLEFLGENVFWPLWVAGLIFFAVNVYIVIRVRRPCLYHTVVVRPI